MTQFSKWKIIGYAAAIFIAGGISGGALGVYQARSNFLAPPPEQEMAVRMLDRFQTRLGLTPDQVAKIKPVIDSAAADLSTIRADTAKRINEVFDASYTQVSALLTPEQRVKLLQMQKEHRERMQRAMSRHHPGGPRHEGPDHDGPDHDGPPPPVSGS